MGSEESAYGLSHVPDETSILGPEFDYLPTAPTEYRPKIGLIGAGGISEYHLRAYQAMGLEVAAICDLDESRAPHSWVLWGASSQNRSRQKLGSARATWAGSRGQRRSSSDALSAAR